MKRKNSSVNFAGMHPDIWPFVFYLDDKWREWTDYELIITSARDGRHSSTSDHYWGGALDVRSWTTETSGEQITGDKRKEIFEKVQTCMGQNWYCLDEGDHFHLSYRPRWK
jgi:hypothetical protein